MAARKLNRPVRLLYDRATDMLMVGKRHPYQGEYHIAYTRDGIIKGMRLDLKSDAGDTYDCSFAVMDLSLLQSDGCYWVETLQANGTVYRTNKPSNTAFRTFGTVQPYAVLEEAIEHVGPSAEPEPSAGRVLPEEIRRKNLYRTGIRVREGLRPDALRAGPDLLQHPRDLGQPVPVVGLREAGRRRSSSSTGRTAGGSAGIAMIPQKYGIAFTEPRGSLNASSALVNVNMADGSVRRHARRRGDGAGPEHQDRPAGGQHAGHPPGAGSASPATTATRSSMPPPPPPRPATT